MPSRTLSDESYIIDLGDEVLGTPARLLPGVAVPRVAPAPGVTLVTVVTQGER
jgi:hypothetical protein